MKFQNLGNSIEKTELTGEWFFLNYGKDDIKNFDAKNFVDIAIPALTGANLFSKEKDNVMQAKLLFCGKNVSGSRAEFFDRKIKGTTPVSVGCKEISNDWMYGIIFGQRYGVSFIVRKDSTYGKKLAVCKSEKGSSCSFDEIVSTGEEWWEKLMRVAGMKKRLADHKWNGIWKAVEKDAKTENFVLGEVFLNPNYSKPENEVLEVSRGEYDNCNNADSSIGKCQLGIVDVAGYSLKTDGKSSIWSNRFTPKISWRT